MSEQRSYYRTNGEIPLLEQTIAEHFDLIVDKYPDHEAVVSMGQKRRLT
ncbi:MAG: hypothetical protein GY934_10610, partial [Gammaproteobacteria bacterium]|nr:hypothetical protein [Gammaproteobacteria bacterium]